MKRLIIPSTDKYTEQWHLSDTVARSVFTRITLETDIIYEFHNILFWYMSNRILWRRMCIAALWIFGDWAQCKWYQQWSDRINSSTSIHWYNILIQKCQRNKNEQLKPHTTRWLSQMSFWAKETKHKVSCSLIIYPVQNQAELIYGGRR